MTYGTEPHYWLYENDGRWNVGAPPKSLSANLNSELEPDE
jgi:hypothetical protein